MTALTRSTDGKGTLFVEAHSRGAIWPVPGKSDEFVVFVLA